MYESYKPHPLLAQVPLTVSPFINLPTSVTLPYTYKSVPSTLPPSVIAKDPNDPDAKPRYVVSGSGEYAAHPDDILASCKSLEQHLQTTRADAQAAIKEWEESIKERELAEKRRVAPGWLDRDEKLLQPMQSATSPRASAADPVTHSILDSQPVDQGLSHVPSVAPRDEGAELDRVFGGLNVK